MDSADRHHMNGLKTSHFSIRRVLFALIWVATLIVFFYAVENWRGNWSWQKYKREMAAKGEPLELSAFVPPPVSDEQNFAMTPFLTSLFDYRRNVKPGESLWRNTNEFNRVIHFPDLPLQELTGGSTNLATAMRDTFDQADRERTASAILKILEKCQPVLGELQAASLRPYSRFNIHYGEGNSPILPHLALLKKLCLVLRYRASAELMLGQTNQAFNDVKLCSRLIDSVKDEPFHISHLVRITSFNLILPVVQEALAKQQWSDSQLNDLQAWLRKLDFIAAFQLAMRGERIDANLSIEQLRNDREQVAVKDDAKTLFIAMIAPRGWYYQNIIAYDRFFQEAVFPVFDPAAKRVYPRRVAEGEVLLEREFKKSTPYNVLAGFLARMMSSVLSGTPIKFALAQSLADQATVACALERYRLVNGHYPEKLESLAPRFIEKLPHDIVNGQPLKYGRVADGQFVLYSAGWDERDDGGVIAMTTGKTPRQDIRQGDWTWSGH